MHHVAVKIARGELLDAIDTSGSSERACWDRSSWPKRARSRTASRRPRRWATP